MQIDTPAFSLTDPLPTGITVLEASAGTGKTYTIAGLAARYVAEGTPLDRLLLVTFTRMATGELRERVRERMLAVEQALGRALAGDPPAGDDEVVGLLASAPSSVVAERRDRLTRALAAFDAATIATTHGFCQEVLGGLGVVADLEQESRFLEDPRDLIEQVVDDLYVRRFHRHDGPVPFTRSQAGEIARMVALNPDAIVAPASGEIPQMRRRLACAVRDEFDRRKRAMAVMTYDDLLTRLDAALGGPGGSAAATKLRERFHVALVDEFQDTDPVQWSIMRRAFGTAGATLVLIGDPKQAIYAFRGADVYAYLDAAHGAACRKTLDVNWRSDQGLIDAFDALFSAAKLGHEGIAYRRVRASDANQAPRLSGAPKATPLRIRVVHRDEPGIDVTPKGYASADSARDHIAQDVARDIAELLSSSATVECRAQDGTTVSSETVQPRHVAVLVRTNFAAALVRDALAQAGVPAVINGAGSVFGTPAAREWLRLLEAVERPSSAPRARAAALTCFFGWSAEEVATADDAARERVHRRLHDWARVLRVKGVASLVQRIALLERLPERLLRFADGERRLTDVRHVGQLLHAAATEEGLGTTALTAWLRRRIAEADEDTANEERSRRLESDAEAVQVLTIHRSKGLEFAIVYLPFLWEASPIPGGTDPVFFHDGEAGDARTVDVSLGGSEFFAHRRQALVEQRGEDLRLMYVALTRARHQAVLWWVGAWNAQNSPLARLLFAHDDDGNVAPDGRALPSDETAAARFEALAADAPGRISVERSRLGMPPWWSPPLSGQEELTTAVFDRRLDWSWRRTSFSDITAAAYEPHVGSEPEEPLVADEPVAGAPPTGVARVGDGGAMAQPSLLGHMPVGVHVGTLVHRVFEAADFAAQDLDAELRAHIKAAQEWRHVEIGESAVAVAGLRAAVETPLGPLMNGVRLRDLDRGSRLDELQFELPLAGGDSPSGELTLAAIARVLREHLAPDDPLHAYADRLGDPLLLAKVRGYLTGSIDLVARVVGTHGIPRFGVIDYKTNWLGPPGEPLTVGHYHPAALGAEMRRAHYALQALLYTTALHRYLRWRLTSYEAEENLAGVFYLFVRGMIGADTPTVDRTPYGVFAWRPPGHLVEALSDVLDAGGTA